jgi:hypothetical protein
VIAMTDVDRARLERAAQHPLYHEAMRRAPQDYAVHVALLALFYLLQLLVFFVPGVFDTAGSDFAVHVVMLVLMALPALPFLIGVLRTWPLRGLPARRVFGLITGPAAGNGRGRWVRIEPADGEPVDLRLRLKAYLESTGGGVGAGSIGVALCKGDHLVEWVAIPDVPEPGLDAPEEPTS